MNIPASYHQERLWFIDKFENGTLYESSPIYHNIPLILNIEGPLDIEILERSIQDVINRHEALRTRIITRDNKPFQCVKQTVDFSLSILDMTGDGNTGGYDKAISCAYEEINQPFLLHQGPLIRGKLIRFESRRFILSITVHHIIADSYSIGILLEEIFLYYNGYIEKCPLKLPDLSIHYADFSQWQRNLPVKLRESLLSYWKSKLSGKLQALELPVDRTRALIHTYQAKWQSFPFPGELCQLINTFREQEGTDSFITLLAVFKVLLYRYTGHDEIVIGISAKNRSQPGLEKTIGPIANLLVTRSFLSNELPLGEFIAALDEMVKDAYQHQHIPFDQLVSEINPDKDMSRTAFFDVLFQYEDTPRSLPPLENLKITVVETNLGWGKYDLNLLVRENGKNFSGILVYNSDIFNDATISRMIGHYLELLKRILENPAQRILTSSILTDREKNHLLTKWNQSRAHYPQDKTIHELFEKQAAGTPHHIAVIGPSAVEYRTYRTYRTYISYRELNIKSNRVAELLRTKGVNPDTIVGIILEKSVEMIIAMMGILKAGGAYLPIDPEYPRERIDYMLSDSGVNLLVTTGSLAEKGEKLRNWEGETILLETAAVVSSSSTTTCQVSPANLAYVIYTSGTTGKPKGVLLNHKNVVRLMVNDKFQFDFSARDVWTMFHSYCFDFSVWEMYGALLYGGKLVMIPRMVARDTGKFLEILKNEGVTILNQTPSAFYSIIQQELNDSGGVIKHGELNIRYIIFGGEALNSGRLKRWKAAYPKTRLINMYGITETTVHVTFKEIHDEDISGNISNIGKPIPTLETYVLNSQLTLQPIGVPGECCVGGDGVARGYLNSPELTGEKFIENPYKPGEKLYRSGDLVKVTNSGDMEYLGRIDRQVKIRGFRIELGEIESRLLKHPEIKEVVVALLERPGGRSKSTKGNNDGQASSLAAYIISTREFTISELKEYLLSGLPSYMLPSYFVQLEKLPLTPNGKIDREALPVPEPNAGEEYINPRNEIEEKLVEIWSNVLGTAIGNLSTNTNFFDMGGHSLNAVKLIAEIHKELDVRLPLAEVFKTPTIRELAQYIKKSSTDKYISIKTVEKKEFYELSPAQKRLYVFNRLYPTNVGHNIFQAFHMEGTVDKQKLEETFRLLIKRHESLRTSFEMAAETPYQVIHYNAQLKIADYQCKEGEELPIINEFVRPFDLTLVPLLRVGLIKNSGDRHILMVDIHHIIIDGESFTILIKDFIALYRAGELPPLKLQYKDFSEWQKKMSLSEKINQQETYWLNKLKGNLPVLDMPTDFPRPQVKSFKSDSIDFEIDSQLTSHLKKLLDETGTTFHMVLLAIFTILLSKYSNQEDIIVGSAAAGRRHADLQGIIGIFVNMLAMRNHPEKNKSVATFLEEVKKNALEAYENQDYQFNELVTKLGIKRDYGKNPIFHHQFTFENERADPDPDSKEIPGLKLKPYGYELGMRQFDLSLTASRDNNKLVMRLKFLTDLYKRETAQKMTEHYVEILQQVVENSDTALKDITISLELSSARLDLSESEAVNFGF
jgi:amino acid adenylation domain-containing protein